MSSEARRWIVAGGGFRGIISAILLRRYGCSVALVERAPHLGGLLYGEEWQQLIIDRGAHLFDNIDDGITELMQEILGDEIVPVDVAYAVIVNGRKIDGLAVPDFTWGSPDLLARALSEFLDAAARTHPSPPRTLHELYEQRFGRTLAELLAPVTRKMLRVPAEELAPDAFFLTPFRRLRFLPDPVAQMLKEIPALDERIALPTGEDRMRHYRTSAGRYPHRNYYPARDGMRGFCEKVKTYLERSGVEVFTGTAIEGIASTPTGIRVALQGRDSLDADRLLWSSGFAGLESALFNSTSLRAAVHAVPMLMYYFLVPADRLGPYAYQHDFDEDHLIFRPSAIGRYGGQIRPDGLTYLCCECVCDLDSDVWKSPDSAVDRVWSEAVALGMASGLRPAIYKIHAIPASYQAARKGYDTCKKAVIDRLESSFGERIQVSEGAAFSKVDIQSAVEAWLR